MPNLEHRFFSLHSPGRCLGDDQDSFLNHMKSWTHPFHLSLNKGADEYKNVQYCIEKFYVRSK